MKGSLAFTSTPSPCQYLPDRIWQLRYEVRPEITPADYTLRLLGGWRRFGPVLFRPECPACRMCQSLRVPVASFRPNESQRRTWRQNAGEVEIRIGPPSITSDKIALSARFHAYGREAKGWPEDGEPDLRFFIRNPFRTEEWTYHLGGRLIGVGYVDALAEGLSAIYFYWDPAEAKRSLGTFNVLAMIDAAKERRVPHVYLGYYVEGCRSLEYKARFTPNEVLRDGSTWEPFLS